jgi:hypothetical protein
MESKEPEDQPPQPKPEGNTGADLPPRSPEVVDYSEKPLTPSDRHQGTT